MGTLVTGAEGYIGQHVCRLLRERCHEVHEMDGAGPALEDVTDADAVRGSLTHADADAVIHLAALIDAGASVGEPVEFWRINVGGTLAVLEAMRDIGASRLVFASSAAAGDPQSPYGRTKLAAEWAIRDCAAAYGLEAVCLRFFNVAGAHPSGEIGEDHKPETHLIPRAIAAALGAGRPLQVHGNCVRDYVHVWDVARACVAALAAGIAPGTCEVLDVGAGRGWETRDVIAAVEAGTGLKVARYDAPRRTGDPDVLIADTKRAGELLGWAPERSDLPTIIADALRWERVRLGLSNKGAA